MQKVNKIVTNQKMKSLWKKKLNNFNLLNQKKKEKKDMAAK